MVELKTHKLWCQYDGCTHRGNSNGSGWENHSSRQTLYVLTFIGKWAYIYLLTLNKKQKMKIMGRVAWLIFVVVVSVCVVFCICAASKTIQCSWVSPYVIFWKMKIMSYVFWQISLSIKLWQEKITTEKNGPVLVFLASVLECHHILYVEKWKLWDIYLLTLNKKWKMKIMGKVAQLILVVVVSVCVVFCVLCCFQNNPVFWSVTIFHILKNENYELCFLANFFVDQITTGNNYKRKKRYCVSFFGECSQMSP